MYGEATLSDVRIADRLYEEVQIRWCPVSIKGELYVQVSLWSDGGLIGMENFPRAEVDSLILRIVRRRG